MAAVVVAVAVAVAADEERKQSMCNETNTQGRTKTSRYIIITTTWA